MRLQWRNSHHSTVGDATAVKERRYSSLDNVPFQMSHTKISKAHLFQLQRNHEALVSWTMEQEDMNRDFKDIVDESRLLRRFEAFVKQRRDSGSAESKRELPLSSDEFKATMIRRVNLELARVERATEARELLSRLLKNIKADVDRLVDEEEKKKSSANLSLDASIKHVKKLHCFLETSQSTLSPAEALAQSEKPTLTRMDHHRITEEKWSILPATVATYLTSSSFLEHCHTFFEMFDLDANNDIDMVEIVPGIQGMMKDCEQ